MASRVDIELYITYTRHKGLFGGPAQNQPSTSVKDQGCTI